MSGSRRILAFKRAPTVELSLGDFGALIKEDRVLVLANANELSFSWTEWRDIARRIEHSIQWITSNTPHDVTGASFDIKP